MSADSRQQKRLRGMREVDALIDDGMSLNEVIIAVSIRRDLPIRNAAGCVHHRWWAATRRHAITSGIPAERTHERDPR